jgi:hypothetical protein
MTKQVGSTINTVDSVTTTTVNIDSVTATTILAENPNRLYARVSLDYAVADTEAFIREYAAATDNNKAGILLTRVTTGNNNLLRSEYTTIPGNVYTGEISAIAETGSFDLHIIEAS